MARDAAKALPGAEDIMEPTAAKTLAATVKAASNSAQTAANKAVNDLVKQAVTALVRVTSLCLNIIVCVLRVCYDACCHQPTRL